jgi:O-antigen/teichoic acid export membrane protein
MLVLVTFIVNAGFNFALGLLIAHFLGPADFGRYAFAQAVGVLINVAFVDWIKLGTTRFYSEKTRAERPSLRPTLDAGFMISSLMLSAISVLFLVSDVNLGLSTALAAMVPAVAISYGLFDYHTAMTRSLFNDALYARIVVGKNLFALLLTVGGAWYFRDPVIVLAGLCLSQIIAWLSVRRPLREPGRSGPPLPSIAVMLFMYAMPIIVANTFYQIVPIYNRAAISIALGVAEMGQYSLAFDLSTKLFSTIGSAFDILLFQLAVRIYHEQGLQAARQQLATNLGLLIGGIAPLALGLWFVLPSLDAIFIPAEFQGVFSSYVAQLIPGLTALSIMLYGLNPVLQIRNRTYPIIIAGIVGILADIVLIYLLPAGAPGTAYAWAQTMAMGMALAVTILFVLAIMPVWPRGRAVIGCLAGLVAMSLVLWPLRALAPGYLTLGLSGALGAGIYLAVHYLFNGGDLRMVLASGRQASPPQG